MLTERGLCVEEGDNNPEIYRDPHISRPGEPEVVVGAQLPHHHQGGNGHAVDKIPRHPV